MKLPTYKTTIINVFDNEECLENDVRKYAKTLVANIIIGDIDKDKIYEDIMDFLERKEILDDSYYNYDGWYSDEDEDW